MVQSFSNIAKMALSVLNDDYKIGKKFLKIKSQAGPVAVVTENNFKEGKDGSYSIDGKVQAAVGGIKGFKVNKVAVDSSGRGDLELALDDVVQGLGFIFKASLFGEDASLKASYVQPQVYSETILDLNFKSITQTVAFGFEDFTLGGEVDLDVESNKFSGYNAGASVNMGVKTFALYTTDADADLKINVAGSFPIENVLAAASATFTPKGQVQVATLGALMPAPPGGVVRAAVDTNKHLKLAFTKVLADKVKGTACVDLDLTNLRAMPAYGLNVQLG